MRKTNKKNAALSYEEYKKKYPTTNFTKPEYEKRYTQQNPHQAPAAQPQSPYENAPAAQQFDPVQSFDKLLNHARSGKMEQGKGKHLLHYLGQKPDKFVDYLFDNLGKKTKFEDIKHFQDDGLIPKSYVERRLKNHDLAGKIPPKFHAEYNIKTSSFHVEWKRIASKLAGEGDRGGKIIGHTSSGKPVYETSDHSHIHKFSPADHNEAIELHRNYMKSTKDLSKQQHHSVQMGEHQKFLQR